MPFPRSSLLPLVLLLTACQPGAANQTSGARTDDPELPGSLAAVQDNPGERPGAPTPLDGLWRQASVTCPDGRTPGEKVDELDFGDSGFFSVTYAPFETYKDYWGRAKFDLGKGDIAFTVERGNFVPPGLDLEGKVLLEGTQLTIREIWLGDRAPGAAPAGGCTYVFKRPWAM